MHFILILWAFALPIVVSIVPTDLWVGSFQTDWFGDSLLTVCSKISDTSGIYYVQGLANEFAYLRGNATCTASTCLWDGSFYYPGIEAVTGIFQFAVTGKLEGYSSLRLVGGTPITMKPTVLHGCCLCKMQAYTPIREHWIFAFLRGLLLL